MPEAPAPLWLGPLRHRRRRRQTRIGRHQRSHHSGSRTIDLLKRPFRIGPFACSWQRRARGGHRSDMKLAAHYIGNLLRDSAISGDLAAYDRNLIASRRMDLRVVEERSAIESGRLQRGFQRCRAVPSSILWRGNDVSKLSASYGYIPTLSFSSTVLWRGSGRRKGSGRTRCGRSRGAFRALASRVGQGASRRRPDSGAAMKDAAVVPLATSRCSNSATVNPRRAASRAMPAPMMPPPMIARSNGASPAREAFLTPGNYRHEEGRRPRGFLHCS